MFGEDAVLWFRPLLEKKLLSRGISWHDAESMLRCMSVDEIRETFEDEGIEGWCLSVDCT